MEAIKRNKNTICFSLICYIGMGLLAGVLTYTVINALINKVMLNLLDPKPDAFVLVSGNIVSISFSGSSAASEVINEPLFLVLQIIQFIAPVIIYSLCVVLAIVFFYRKRLKRPLYVLNEGIEKISRQELDFEIEHSFKNELGLLCEAFESMRSQLVKAFNDLWEAEENQRSIYRAFAHDLRTPLTIIKGNNDNILYIGRENKDWEVVTQSVELTGEAVKRIELYAEQLKDLETTAEIRPILDETSLKEISQIIQRQAEILSRQYNVEIVVDCAPDEKVMIDSGILLRVLDNILDNAIQYARSKIEIEIVKIRQQLVISVSDDGSGFQENNIKKVTAPFFSTKKADGHTGIGLTISLKLLECCGGYLEICNRTKGGANVKFFLPV